MEGREEEDSGGLGRMRGGGEVGEVLLSWVWGVGNGVTINKSKKLDVIVLLVGIG